MNLKKDLWATLAGSDPKEMKIIMGGRHVGKSIIAQMWNQTFEIREYFSKIDQSTVDGDLWYTVKCSEEISQWIKTQPKGMWHNHIDKNWQKYKDIFDIHEKIYTILQLKYSDERI